MIRTCLRCVVVLLVLASLAGLGIATWLMPTTRTFEKRKLADMPARPATAEAFREWPRQIEAWWSDAGYGRQDLMRWHNLLREVLGISPQSGMLIGKDGWLFFADGDVLDDYRNSRLYSEAELDRWEAYLLYRHQSARQHGAVYYLVIPPNKHNIYPEYLPAHIKPLSTQSRLDQIIERMSTTEVRIIDLRSALLEAKTQRQAYHKGDSHWNLWGAYAGYSAILDVLEKDFPDLDAQHYTVDQFVDADDKAFVEADVYYYNGLYYMLGVAGERRELQPLLMMPGRECVKPGILDLGRWKDFREEVRERLFVTEQCDTGKYRALLFRDSFAELLKPFFSSTFAYSAYIRMRRPMAQQYWDHFIEAASPDIVIDEMISRHLRHIPQAGRDYPAREGDVVAPSADDGHYEFD